MDETVVMIVYVDANAVTSVDQIANVIRANANAHPVAASVVLIANAELTANAQLMQSVVARLNVALTVTVEAIANVQAMNVLLEELNVDLIADVVLIANVRKAENV